MTRVGRVAAMAGTGVAVLALALWRRDIPFSTLTRRYADRSSRFLDLPNGIRLHYRDVGRADAPVMICLHGYSASSLDWLLWSQRMSTDYRLLLVDLPGHGLTAAPAAVQSDITLLVGCVAALVDALDLQTPVLVGNSMGGQVAMTYAVAHPDRPAALVLIASLGAADPAQAAAPPPLVIRLLASPVGRLVLRHIDLTAVVRRGLRHAMGDEGQVTDALVRQVTDLARAPGHRAILTGLQLGRSDAGLLPRLAVLACPSLVIAGDADPLVSVAQARTIAAALPRARLIIYPGVRHVPMQEIPDRLARNIRDWLAAEAGPLRSTRPD